MFVFDCPAYCLISNSLSAIFWRHAPALYKDMSSFFALHDPNYILKWQGAQDLHPEGGCCNVTRYVEGVATLCPGTNPEELYNIYACG